MNIFLNKKTCLEIVIIISICTSVGIIKNLISKESLPLFSKYNHKLEETGSFQVKNLIQINAESVMHLNENSLAIIIDIRPYTEYKNGHIPASLTLKENVDSLNYFNFSNSNKIIIIFSDESSNKSISKFCVKLIKKGVKNILVYKKGIEDWMKNGLPIEKGNT